MNDSMYKCKENDRGRLEKEKTPILEGYTVKARYGIIPDCKIKSFYDG